MHRNRIGVCFILLVAIVFSAGQSTAQSEPDPIKKPFRDVAFLDSPIGMPQPDASMDAPLAPDNLYLWSKLVYQSYRDGNWEIYIAQGDGTNAVNISNHPSADARPSVDQGYNHVAFNSDRYGNSDIFVVNSNGTGLTRLTTATGDDYAPSWSPDNSRIVFVSRRNGNSEIYVMNADGSGQTSLTNNAASDSNPTWSPDNSQIAWVRYSGDYGAIWIMNADGSNQHQITNNKLYMGLVAWSKPIVSKIVCDYDYDVDGWNELMMMNVDGSGLGILYDARQANVDIWAGSFSPDEYHRAVLFTRIEYVVSGGQLYVNRTYIEAIDFYNPSGTGRIVGSGYDMLPQWRTADIWPPLTHVKTLPEYSRASGFTVQWSGADIGPAGMVGYEMYYKFDGDASWTRWNLENVSMTSKKFTGGSPGDKVYFFSRARDEAANVEGWHTPEWDTYTTLYTWQLGGSLSDNHGYPIPEADVNILPAPAVPAEEAIFGKYHTWLLTEGDLTVAAHASGYGAFPPSRLNIDADEYRSLYLPPQDDLIQKGGFEEQDLSGWTISGSATLNNTLEAAHTGVQGLLLGDACLPPCLGAAETITPTSAFLGDFVIDAVGNIHTVYTQFTMTGTILLFYSWRSPIGEWSIPIEIGSNYPHCSSNCSVNLDIDGLGILHAVWTSENDGIFYSQKPVSGPWQPIQRIATGWSTSMSADDQGGVHIIYANNGARYLERIPAGTWNSYIQIGSEVSLGYPPDLDIGPDGTIHFIYTAGGGYVCYRSYSQDGILSTEYVLSPGSINTNQVSIATGPAGEVHVYMATQAGDYAYRTPDGVWSNLQHISDNEGIGKLEVDESGDLYLISNALYYMSPFNYFTFSKSEGFSTPNAISGLRYPQNYRIERKNVVHVMDFTSPISYQRTRLADQDDDFEISQTVSLPPAMHRPTLAFFTKMIQTVPAGQSSFEVRVSDGVTSTQVYTRQQGADWAQGWADLSPWSGQQIQVRFILHQKAGEPPVQLYLDDISLGSWLTPVVVAVSPNDFGENWASTPITITGENFIQTPTVFIGNLPASNIEYINDHTLTATLPDLLTPGYYDIWVINPGQQRGVLMRGLMLGRLVHIPQIWR
jgi:hypothetical protein